MSVYLSWKKIIGVIALLAFIATITFTASVRTANFHEVSANSFNHYLAMGLLLDCTPKAEKFSEITLCLLNFLIFQFTLGRTVDIDFSICGEMIFTRQKSRGNWYIKRIAMLITLSVLFNLAYYFLGSIVLLLMGIPIINIGMTVAFVLVISLTAGLFMFAFALLISILSLIFKGSIALCGVNIMLVLSTMMSIFWYEKNLLGAFKLNFIANIMPQWHEITWLSTAENPSIFAIPGFNHLFSIIYLTVVSVIIAVFGWAIVNKKDIL